MITKETTKRAAKILAAQKKEYARSFEAAKGNSKAIAKAAADYRAEYGKTPKKRWANALSQAAKETATHSRPVKKTAAKPAAKPAKPQMSAAALVKQIEESRCYLMYGADVICYIEHGLKGWTVICGKPGMRENISHGPYKDRETAVKDAEAYRAGVTGYTFVHESAWTKDWRKARNEALASERRLQEQKQQVEKRRASRQASREKAKAAKPKATYRVGTYLQSPQGDVYRIVAANVMPLKNPYIRYDLREYMGNTHYTLDDKPDKIAAWKYLSPKDGLKMWKQKIASERRAREAKEAAERKEEEKRRIAEQKAIVRRNPEWIKSFAKQTGLTPATIDALYKLCTKDDLRQVMWGVYVSEDGDLVATDAHVLAAVSVNAPKSLRGKIFAPSGKTVEGRYPNYKGVLVSRGKVKVYVGHAQVSRSYDYSDNKPGAEFQDYRGNTCIEIGNQRFVADSYKRLMKVFDSLHEKPLCLQTGEETTAAGFVSNHIKSVIMPVLKE